MAPRRIRRTDSSVAIGYLRVSTDEQQNGIEAQRRAILRWAKANDITVVAWHVDRGVSGGVDLDQRPALIAALEEQRERRAGLLVVAKRDRLARDVVFAGMIDRLAQRQGARVVSTEGNNDDTPEGMLTRGISDLFAQYERALIRFRTKSALAVKKARGERVGSVPYGYRLGDDQTHLEAEPGEQAILARMRALRASGLPLRAIVADLEQSGARARGSRWHLTTVARLLSA